MHLEMHGFGPSLEVSYLAMSPGSVARGLCLGHGQPFHNPVREGLPDNTSGMRAVRAVARDTNGA